MQRWLGVLCVLAVKLVGAPGVRRRTRNGPAGVRTLLSRAEKGFPFVRTPCGRVAKGFVFVRTPCTRGANGLGFVRTLIARVGKAVGVVRTLCGPIAEAIAFVRTFCRRGGNVVFNVTRGRLGTLPAVAEGGFYRRDVPRPCVCEDRVKSAARRDDGVSCMLLPSAPMTNAQRQQKFQAAHPGYDRRRKARERAMPARDTAATIDSMRQLVLAAKAEALTAKAEALAAQAATANAAGSCSIPTPPSLAA